MFILVFVLFSESPIALHSRIQSAAAQPPTVAEQMLADKEWLKNFKPDKKEIEKYSKLINSKLTRLPAVVKSKAQKDYSSEVVQVELKWKTYGADEIVLKMMRAKCLERSITRAQVSDRPAQ